MQFGHPHLLWALLVMAPAFALFFWWAWKSRQRILGQFIAARLLTALTANVSTSRQKARLALVFAALLLAMLALARPQIGFSWEEARSRGLDIVVAIDTSKSMLAADVAPNRLRRAQLAALDLKRLARADRLALVAFAGSAFLQCPLTLDDEAFRQSVDALDVNIIPQGGSALAEAIASAKSAFKKENDNHKVLVIFTDGEDNEGSALEAAKTAGKEGMRIFTIGVGTANGELLRVTDTQGRTEFIKDENGNAVKSRLNEALLQDVARETGGFFILLSGANTMNLLYERGLAPLPKSDLASQRVKRPHERYQWLLGFAVVLLFGEMLLSERKQVKARAESLPAKAASKMTQTAALVALLLMPGVVSASSKAFKQYREGRYEAALTEYERSLKSKPDDPKLHFNAGSAAFQSRNYDQALAHFNSALVTPEVPLQQQAYYNLGNTQFRLGENAASPEDKQKLWEQSLKNYGSALTLNTNDADAAFNRELVQKKLEELKQQQQQQQDKKDEGDKKDDSKQDQDSKEQQKKDEQKKEEQSKEQQQKDGEKQKPEESKEQQEQQEKEKQEQAQEQKEAEKKKAQEAQKKAEQGKEQDQGEAQGQPGTAVQMTPQQAVQLLEALRADEKTMPFRPVLKTNRQQRIFKDW